MSNLQFPYLTSDQFLKPKFTVTNTSDLKISSNTINFYDMPELNKLIIDVIVPAPKDIDMLIERHENIRNATKCVIQIISRQSLKRKEIELTFDGINYLGSIEITRKDFVDTTNLKTILLRDKTLKEQKSKFLAADKGSILAFSENDLVINFKKIDFSKGMPIKWIDFTNPSRNIDEQYQESLYFLEIDGPNNYPVLYFNEKYKNSGIADVIKTEDKNNKKFKNKELLHSFLYDRTMGRLLNYVLHQLEKQKFEIESEFNDENDVLIDNLEKQWQKDLIRDFAIEFCPGTENLENALSIIEKTISDGNVDGLIKKIDLVIQSKGLIHKKFVNYYDDFLHSFHQSNKEDGND